MTIQVPTNQNNIDTSKLNKATDHKQYESLRRKLDKRIDEETARRVALVPETKMSNVMTAAYIDGEFVCVTEYPLDESLRDALEAAVDQSDSPETTEEQTEFIDPATVKTDLSRNLGVLPHIQYLFHAIEDGFNYACAVDKKIVVFRNEEDMLSTVHPLEINEPHRLGIYGSLLTNNLHLYPVAFGKPYPFPDEIATTDHLEDGYIAPAPVNPNEPKTGKMPNLNAPKPEPTFEEKMEAKLTSSDFAAFLDTYSANNGLDSKEEILGDLPEIVHAFFIANSEKILSLSLRFTNRGQEALRGVSDKALSSYLDSPVLATALKYEADFQTVKRGQNCGSGLFISKEEAHSYALEKGFKVARSKQVVCHFQTTRAEALEKNYRFTLLPK